MHYARRSLAILALSMVVPLLLVGCDSSGSAQEQTQLSDFDVDALLQQEAGGVIATTYSNLESEAKTLEEEVKAFQANPTTQTLQDAQQAWIETRDPWEASESFLFGPVAFDGLDPALDSWPADEAEIKSILSGSQDLTSTSVVEGFNTNARGFHTVEFFLFGEPNGDRSPSYFTSGDNASRKLNYLVTATEVLHGDTEELATAWGSGAQFRSDFTSGSGDYSSKKASLQQLAEGMQIIANEVGANKLGTPINDGDIRNVESKFSGNSFVDFRNNVKSIKRIYTGDAFGDTGKGLDTVIKELDPEAHDQLTTQINDAMMQLGNLNGTTTFRDAVRNDNTSEAESARQKIIDIRETIVNEIKPALSNL